MSELAFSLRQRFAASHIINAGYTAVFFGLQLKIAINFAFYDQITLKTLFLYLLAFKLGEFINEISHFGKTRLWALISVVSIVVAVFTPVSFAAVGYFFFGLSMMRVRDVAAHSSPRVVKYAARAFGFVVAPLIPEFALVLILGFSAALALSKSTELGERPDYKITLTQPRNLPVYLVMMLHHAHYFAYAYAIPLIFADRTALPPHLMGLIFYIGWAAYNAYEWYLKPRWIWLIVGHILAAAALLLIPFAASAVPLLALWFVTGLGGGTVYMLRDLLPFQTEQSQQELKIAEGIGHLVGITVWFIAMLAQPSFAPFLSGCVLGVLATFASCYIGVRQHKH